MSPQYTPLEEHLLAAVECADLGDVDTAAEHLRHALGLDPRPSLDRALRELEESLDPTMVDLRLLLADDLAAFPSGVEAGSALGALDDDFFGAELVIEAPVDGDDDARQPITDEIPELDLDDLAPADDDAAHSGELDEFPAFDLEPADDDLQGFDLDDLIDTEALDRHTGDHVATDDDDDASDLAGMTDPPFSTTDRDDTLGGLVKDEQSATDTGSVTVPVPLFEQDEEPGDQGVLDEPQTAPGGDELDVFAAGEFAFYDEPDAADSDAGGDNAPDGLGSDDLGSDNRAALAAGARYHAEAPPPPTHRRRSSPVDTHAGVEPRLQTPDPHLHDEDDDDDWVLGFGASNTGADHNAVEVDTADPDAFARAISGMHPPSERAKDGASQHPGPSDAAATVETDVVDAPLPPPRKRRSGQHRGTSLSTRPVPLVEDEDVHPSGASAMTGAPSESGSRNIATAPGMRAFDSPELALARARTLRDRGDIASAIQTVDALLENDPNDHRAHALRKSLLRQLTALRMSQLEPLDRVPRLAGRPAGLTPRSMFLLTFVDGMSSLQDIIDVSGLPPAEAGELLLELLDAGAIALR